MSFKERKNYTDASRKRAAKISRDYRRKHNLSQAAFAKQLKAPCQSYVSGLETGRFIYSNAFLKAVLELDGDDNAKK